MKKEPCLVFVLGLFIMLAGITLGISFSEGNIVGEIAAFLSCIFLLLVLIWVY